MIQISGRQARPAVAALALLSWAFLTGTATAARIDDLYAASVQVTDVSPEATRAAFAEALRLVLVKVTGRGSAVQDAQVMSHFANPEAMVQQFRRDGAGNLWAQFDASAVRRGLDAAGLPAWSDNRPATVVWLAYDTGAGERDVLAGAGPDGPVATALRRDLLAAAAARAVPVVLPLLDSQDLAAVTYADLWGDFAGPVIKASGRYQADAVLIGRARLFPAGMTDVRWTLLLGNERQEWRGGVADGPQGLAERLAQRLASAGIAGGPALRFGVSGIRTLDDYGRVLSYLQAMDVIESLSVGYLSGDTVMFDLKVRGDSELLTRTLAVGRVVEPVSDPGAGQAAVPAIGPPPALAYRLTARP